MVSPTGFEPVHPAPEAGALSGLSYGDAVPVYKEAPRSQAVPKPQPDLTDSVTDRHPARAGTLLSSSQDWLLKAGWEEAGSKSSRSGR
jgi:hypothetical protein